MKRIDQISSEIYEMKRIMKKGNSKNFLVE